LMVTYNIFKIKEINKPSSKMPEEIIILKEKLNGLSFIMTETDKKAKDEKQLLNKLFGAKIGKKDIEKSVSSKYKKEIIKLPVIKGIIKSLDAEGNIRVVILVNGKGFSEGQKINGFLIKKITDNGVYLLKNGKKWFVSLPEVSFSIVNE